MKPARVVCAAGLVVAVVGMCLAGHNTSHATTPAAVVSPAAQSSADWTAQIDNAIDGLHAAQSALTSQPATGQPLDRLLKDCQARVADYNRTALEAGTYWPSYIQHPITADQACKETQ